MTAHDEATALIAKKPANQPISDHGVLPVALSLLAIAEAIDGLAAAVRERA
jgi:hypothetical protein